MLKKRASSSSSSSSSSHKKSRGGGKDNNDIFATLELREASGAAAGVRDPGAGGERGGKGVGGDKEDKERTRPGEGGSDDEVPDSIT